MTTLPSPVLFDTAEEDLPLYESVQVKLEDGIVAYIPVISWTHTNYNAEKAGTYSFVGTLDTSNTFREQRPRLVCEVSGLQRCI